LKPFIIPVFIPHAGCPHQCSFCNQKVISGQGSGRISRQAVREQADRFLAFPHDKRRTVQISFYGGNFLGLPRESIRSLLDEAVDLIEQGTAEGIRFSTRPDTISSETLKIIRDYPIQTVEIGVQSMDDTVLDKARRGHTALDTVKALGHLAKTPYEVGLQMMTGLPGDSDSSTRMTARKIAEFAPAFVRIYPTLVLKGSPLAGWYTAGKFRPLTLDETVARVKSLYLFFQNQSIPVIRMGLQASEELDSEQTVLAGPYHPAFGHLVLSSIWLDKATELLSSEKTSSEKAVLHVRPENISKLRGLRNQNIRKLMQQFKMKAIEVLPDEKLTDEEIRLEWKAT
jgi:histone acetyltransferase (RNA polymerase elongator complex component)